MAEGQCWGKSSPLLRGQRLIAGIVKNSCASLSVGFIVVFNVSVHHTPRLVPVRPLPQPRRRRCDCSEAKTVGSGHQWTHEASPASLAGGPTPTPDLSHVTQAGNRSKDVRTGRASRHCQVQPAPLYWWGKGSKGRSGCLPVLPVPGVRDPSLTWFNHSHRMDEKSAERKCL